MRSSIVASLIALTACSSGNELGGSGAASGSGSGSAVSPTKKGSSGFSAQLTAELAKEGSAAEPAAGSAAVAGAGSATATATAVTGAGSGSATATPVATGSGSATTTPVAGAGSGSASAPRPGPGSAAAPVVASGSASKPASEPGPGSAAKPAAGTGSSASGSGPVRPPDHRGPVKVPAELAEIKLDLEVNWHRDWDEAGTISFVLEVPNSADTRLFVFHYGYDPASAPSDRDQYMKWLADQKLLNVTLNRQRGAAWYLEGTDGGGTPAFRYLVNYGGKHLICGGPLYKDAASSQLGDSRDKVVLAAKKICETLTL